MFKKIKSSFVVLASLIAMGAPMLAPAAVFATDPDIAGSVCTGTTDASGGDTGDCTNTSATDKLKSLAASIVNLISIVVGIVAVIMIIFGGFKYITSGGDSSNVSGAKNTLVYAIVGLIIVALAQFIVHFVLSSASNANLT